MSSFLKDIYPPADGLKKVDTNYTNYYKFILMFGVKNL